MYRRIFLQSTQSVGARVLRDERTLTRSASLGTTFIFSSIGDALSRAYNTTRDAVGEVADKVSESVSDAYDATARGASNAAEVLGDAFDATRDAVGNAADQVMDKASDAYEATVETLSQAADTVADVVSDAYDSSREAVSSGYDATRDYVEDVASGEKEINYWAVLGGAAIGVGAVAAAPFTGGGSLLGAASLAGSLAGAGTVAAAVGVGVAGAVVGANMGGDDDVRQAAYAAGQKDAKAEHLEELQVLRGKLGEAVASLKVAGQHFNAIVALHAVAVAVATCEGAVSEAEREGIDLFISGLSGDSLPDTVAQRIESLYLQPPTVKEAFQLARESALDMGTFDEIINLVVHADGGMHPREAAFMQAWNHLKSA